MGNCSTLRGDLDDDSSINQYHHPKLNDPVQKMLIPLSPNSRGTNEIDQYGMCEYEFYHS